jgi:hypothetical protein
MDKWGNYFCAAPKDAGGTNMLRRRTYQWSVVVLTLWPASAWATQTHGGLEGLWVHQAAHLFFAFSMGLLIFWLRKWRLTVSQGWRHIQFAALFFIAWNMDAMASHWLQEQSGLIEVRNIAPLQMQIITADNWHWLSEVYYLTKLDHLLSVPALVFLFLGFRRLLHIGFHPAEGGQPAP